MKTVSVSVPDSVLTAIEPGDSVVLRAGRRRLTLKAVAERKPTKAESAVPANWRMNRTEVATIWISSNGSPFGDDPEARCGCRCSGRS